MYNFKNDKLHVNTHYETMELSFSVVALLYTELTELLLLFCVRNFRCAPNDILRVREMRCSLHHENSFVAIAIGKRV